MDWKSFFKTVTNPYKAAGVFYTGAGHHGVDFACSPHGSIPSYFEGTPVLNGHSSVLGNYSVFKRADGLFAGFAHLLVGSRLDKGAKVKPGDVIGKAATWGDDHGSAWDGSHCHTTVSHYLTGVYDGRTVDPWPSIKAARAAKPQVVKKPTSARPYVHVVAHDTLGKIAAKYKVKYGTTVAKLTKLNKIKNADAIIVGQKIYLK